MNKEVLNICIEYLNIRIRYLKYLYWAFLDVEFIDLFCFLYSCSYELIIYLIDYLFIRYFTS